MVAGYGSPVEQLGGQVVEGAIALAVGAAVAIGNAVAPIISHVVDQIPSVVSGLWRGVVSAADAVGDILNPPRPVTPVGPPLTLTWTDAQGLRRSITSYGQLRYGAEADRLGSTSTHITGFFDEYGLGYFSFYTRPHEVLISFDMGPPLSQGAGVPSRSFAELAGIPRELTPLPTLASAAFRLFQGGTRRELWVEAYAFFDQLRFDGYSAYSILELYFHYTVAPILSRGRGFLIEENLGDGWHVRYRANDEPADIRLHRGNPRPAPPADLAAAPPAPPQTEPDTVPDTVPFPLPTTVPDAVPNIVPFRRPNRRPDPQTPVPLPDQPDSDPETEPAEPADPGIQPQEPTEPGKPADPDTVPPTPEPQPQIPRPTRSPPTDPVRIPIPSEPPGRPPDPQPEVDPDPRPQPIPADPDFDPIPDPRPGPQPVPTEPVPVPEAPPGQPKPTVPDTQPQPRPRPADPDFDPETTPQQPGTPADPGVKPSPTPQSPGRPTRYIPIYVPIPRPGDGGDIEEEEDDGDREDTPTPVPIPDPVPVPEPGDQPPPPSPSPPPPPPSIPDPHLPGIPDPTPSPPPPPDAIIPDPDIPTIIPIGDPPPPPVEIPHIPEPEVVVDNCPIPIECFDSLIDRLLERMGDQPGEQPPCDPEPVVLTTPDYWQLRVGQRPQMVLTWRGKTRRSSYWQTAIPHPREDLTPENLRDRLPQEFQRGPSYCRLILPDNSRIHINAVTQPVARQVAYVLLELVEPDQRLTVTPSIGTTGRASSDEVIEPAFVDFYPHGQYNITPSKRWYLDDG